MHFRFDHLVRSFKAESEQKRRPRPQLCHRHHGHVHSSLCVRDVDISTQVDQQKHKGDNSLIPFLKLTQSLSLVGVAWVSGVTVLSKRLRLPASKTAWRRGQREPLICYFTSHCSKQNWNLKAGVEMRKSGVSWFALSEGLHQVLKFQETSVSAHPVNVAEAFLYDVIPLLLIRRFLFLTNVFFFTKSCLCDKA